MHRRVVPANLASSSAARGVVALALLSGISVYTAFAQDRSDPLAGARQLRGSQVRALRDATTSGITRDVGHLAVIEHDGTNYDKEDASGNPNYAARAAVARRFYETHGDNYDFLVVFTNFEFETGDALAFMNPVRNDVRGIGIPVLDLGAPFGSPGRLKGYIDMAALPRYREPPQSLEPGHPGYLVTLGVVAHEVGHQWLAQVRYRDAAGADVSDLIGHDGVHWSYLLDSDASFLFGSEWVPAGTGMFRAERIRETYSSLDLYLMGLLDPARVAPWTLLRNPAVDPAQVPVEGATVAAVPESLRIEQVVAAEGTRSPGAQASQKEFRLGFIFLTAPGVEPSAEDLAAADRVRESFAGHFFFHTRGVAIADTSLAEEPGPPPAPAPDLDRATAWLLARQSADGRWEDSPGTAARDTAAAVEALAPTLEAAEAVGRGRAWLWPAPHPTTDHAARRAVALAEPGLGPASRQELLDSVLSHAASGGGFGIARGYMGDALDTALALRALAALDRPADAAVAQAITTLAELRHPSGGWAMVQGGEVSAVVTAEVVLALQAWPSVPQAQALVAPALAALATRRNADGGFGESPSTPYATALALRALLAAQAPANLVDGASAWLQSTQRGDGSWGGAYSTALVIAALRASQGPNLVVPQDSLRFEPASATEGQVVAVSAVVRNVGRRVAQAQHARLYDGDPALGQVAGEMAVGALESGESAPVHFDFDTTGRPGARTLYVVADAAGEVREVREDDNAASRALTVAGLLPDLEVGAFDITLAPYPPQEGETVTVSVAVHNRGQRASLPVPLDVTRGDPRAGGQPIGRATVPAVPPGQSRTVSIQWDTTGQAGTHELFVSADADFRLPESDETNNVASQVVTVASAPASGVDLELAQLRAVPARLSTIPQDGIVEALVRNLGSEPASSVVALHDGSPHGPPLGERPVALAPRSSQVVMFEIQITEPGSRTFVAIADPSGTVEETREDNNQASASLIDGQDTLDVEVPPGEVAPSSLDVAVGEALTVAARVRNRGTAAIADVPVILAHVTEGGRVELARHVVTLAPGASASLSFTWAASIVGDAVPLAVVADPFALFDELSEANNAVGFTIRVRPSDLPNLAVAAGGIHFAPDPPQEGGSATLSALVRNTGAVPAPEFTVRFFRGDPAAGGTPIGHATVPSVAAGASVTASVVWSPVDSGGAFVFVVADSDGQVEEYDETDNRAFRAVGVLGLPDLVLTAGDVALTPGFPRAGEGVTVAATVRNLGGQPSAPTTLRAWEGEAGGGVVIGDAPIPALQPQQAATLSLSWTPAAPPGEVTLTLAADAPDSVREADEGNNLARRQVVIQNADVYLTAPFFSPDGDGRQDVTTLAWRATGSVNVVVSDRRGRRVRTLATEAPAQGSAAWDGRDERGRLLWDGAYTLTVEAPGGLPLARTSAVIDTNRNPIQEAAATGLVSLHNMTCRLPSLSGPAWMPAEDEALFIVHEAAAGVEPGLIRVALNGDWSYVGPGTDPWYESDDGDPAAAPRFVSSGAVSPDGREALIQAGADLVAVDLISGDRRVVVGGNPVDATWSPDGRWIALGNRVVSRDGSQEISLPTFAYEWSPDGEWLTSGGGVMRRDGTGVRGLPVPAEGQVQDVHWLGDGRILVRRARDPGLEGGREPDGIRSFLVDPDTGAFEELTWLDAVAFGFLVHPTPDGGRIAYPQTGGRVNVVRADGTNLRLVDLGERGFSFGVSPHDRIAFYSSDAAAQPGQACEGLGSDVFALSNLQNMTLDLQADRLPANNGLRLRGTATDRYLDHYQLEYATAAEPTEWRPIGPASAVPVIADTLAVWVPPGPGTYALRLRAQDLAGNQRAATRVVAWDRTPSLANLAQSERLISPTGDGVKDSVQFTYLVVTPATVEVRIHGPETTGQTAPLVRRLSLPYPQPGPGGFEWDGRDEGGGVVRDGRYTVSVNDVPFRVNVDATPPDLAWSYHGLISEPRDDKDPSPGRVVAERRWHVVDPHLASWSYRNAFFTETDTEQVFEPERDAQGEIVYENGVPRIRYEAGRPADLRIKDEDVEALGTDPTALLSASDHAGNRSSVPVLPVAEKLFLLAAYDFPPTQPEGGRLVAGVPLPAGPLALTPVSRFTLGETLRGTPPNAPADVRFEYRVVGAAQWTAGPSFTGREWASNFDALGLSPSATYQGRFVGQGTSTQSSEQFQFRVVRCDVTGTLGLDNPTPVPGTPLLAYPLRVSAIAAVDPIVAVQVTATGPGGFVSTMALQPQADGSFTRTLVGPAGDCTAGIMRFGATLTGQSGATYAHDGSCRELAQQFPQMCLGAALVQTFPFCAATPDQAYFGVSVPGLPDGTVELKAGDVVVGGFEIAQGQVPLRVSIDARGLPEGRVPVVARHQNGTVIQVAGPPEDSDVEGGDPGKAPFIDKTPQAVDILAPVELGRVCVNRDNQGRDTVGISLRALELGEQVELSTTAQFRRGDGPWTALDVMSPTQPLRLPTGGTTGLVWKVTGLSDGEYTVRLPTCDRAGHTAVDERRLRIARTPPTLSIVADRTVFSPNGDGRADTVTTTATFTQPVRLTVEIRRENVGGPIVRRLVTDQPYGPGSPVFAWDGRDDAGVPVPDGVYVIVARGRDECAVTAQAQWRVEVDTQPPLTSISTPAPAQTVVAGVDVRGVADDPRFRSFELAFGTGPAPGSWTVFSTSPAPAPAPGRLLGRWNAPPEEGVYVLRLQATDNAENTATVMVAVTVDEPTLIDRLTVSPPAFSPNGDGRVETATVEYVLRAPATVRLEVRGAGGALLRTLVPGVAQPAGLHSIGWDGATDGGAPAPEGEHQVHLEAEAAPIAQESSAALTLDRTPPQVSVTSPAAGAYVTPQGTVRGSVLDPRLSSFVVRAQPPSGPAVEIGRGASEVSNGELASLAPLQDGAHLLTVMAEDAAANRTSAEVDVTVDAVAPVASLLPLGAVVHRGTAPIDVTGTAADANLREYVLAFGAGAQPATFVEIARSTGAVQGASLGQWTVAALPDGTYTLRLVVTDKAGQSTEARLTLVLDGTDPVASLSAPAEGARINVEAEVRGSAEDANFGAWTLEMAPGPASQAQQWTLVATGEAPVSAGVLGSVAPLPPDGTHTLRLTVRDAASHSVAVLRSFKVDTVPPAAPGALQAEVTRTAPTADVHVRWDAVSDADLAGYVVRRDGSPLTPDPIAATQYVDAGRGDGGYRYEVLAVDVAGNAGPAAAIAVRVDLTPPIVDITGPRAGDALSGSVDVRGSAFSAGDFKEYRLLAGAGAAPSSWTLLERSSLPVASARLGSWEALAAGPYVLALEADDDTGNTARVTVAVMVDNVAPTAPVLATLVNAPSSDALTATWHASPEPDVRGYLLYRNGLLANGTGVVVGDLRPYLLPGPSYVDAALPDGEHCYRVTAMDRAGNLSPPSSPLCHSLDNRRPHAVIVEPPDGTRFEFPLHVLADTPDRDVQQVQFQIKPAAEDTWQALGAADTQAPFEVTLDPDALAPGAYDLRAVARDAAGEDPGPVSIRVVYGDTTAPAAPQGLVARVDGRSVSLTWTPNVEADLAGYHVWRGTERVTEAPVSSTSFVDTVAAPGAYTYRVTAVDADANESAPSAVTDALVYVLELLPAFPVTLDSSVALPGDGAVAETALEVRRDGSVIAQVNVADAGAFTVPAVPLVTGANVLTAHAADAAGNRSIPSDEAVLILNAPPPAVADVEVAVDGHTVDLSWPAVAAPDLFGYAVARGATDLTPPVPQTDYASVSASSSAGPGFEPERALDSDPGTSWIPDPDAPSATWTVTFPEAVLLRKVSLTFPDAVPDYRIEALWEGRYLPLARVHGNTEISVEHVLPSSFATGAVRVVMSGPVLGLSEVSIEKRGLTTVPSFQDTTVPDGTHEYAVRAVDRYGAEAEAAVRTVDVGDVTPPAAPGGVSAVVSGADVLLAWTASPEEDLSHYVVLRDGAPIASSEVPGYLDAGLPNGTYRYAVVAADAVGNRSAPSAEVTATVAIAPPAAPVLSASALPNGSVALAWTHAGAAVYVVHRAGVSGGPYTVVAQTGDARAFLDPTALRGVEQFYRVHAVDARGNPSAQSNEAAATPDRTEAPAAPVVLVPTDADRPLTVMYTDATIEGRAEAHSLVSVEANGTLRGVVEAGDPFAQAASGALNQDAAGPVVSPDGRRVAYAVVNPVPAVLWRDLATQFSGAFTHPGSDGLLAQAFSPDGARLAYRMQACDGSGACRSDLFVADLGGGAPQAIEDGDDDVVDAAWSPDGRRLAFTTATEAICALWVRELDPPATRQVFSAGECLRPRFAPDSARAALAARAEGDSVWRLVVVDLDLPATSVIAQGVWPQTVPSWSHDGTRVAFTSAASAALRARIHDLVAGTTADVTDPQLPSFDPQLDTQGGWISFTALRSTADGPVRDLVAEDLARGGRRTVATWAGGAEAGPIALHAWAAHHTLAVAFPDRVALFAAEGQFRLDGVRLGPGENLVVARATDPDEGLTSADSRPIRLAVPADLFANLRLTNDGLSTYPSMPQVGQGTLLKAHVGNTGSAPAFDVPVLLTIRDAAGVTRHEQGARISQLEVGQAAWVTSLWTPAAEGSFGFRTVADPQDAVAESREDDNRADLGVLVAPPGGLGVRVTSDRAEYAVNAAVLLSVRLTNGGAAFSGEVRTTVEAGPATVAVIDSRQVTLAYGQSLDFTLGWNTGLTYAGDYAFVTRAVAPAGAVQSAQPFRILPNVNVSARILPGAASVPQGHPLSFTARVGNDGLNAPLEGASARLRVRPAGAPETVFIATAPLPRILPGGSWEGALAWPSAQPAGDYVAELEVLAPAPLASASAPFKVVAPPGSVVGTLSVAAHALRGEGALAQATVTNTGTAPLTAKAFAVEVASGETGEVLVRAPFTLDLPPGQTRAATVTVPTATLPAGAYPVFLRAATPPLTLDRRTLHVHGPIGAPSVDSPVPGARVPTSHPTLVVGNAAAPPGTAVTYEFEVFADAALTQPLPGARGVAETPERTGWRVQVNLTEDRTFYWRARAGDGTAVSPWSGVGSFTVDETNLAPSAPVPDTPPPGARVASREPLLTVKNALDLDLDPLTYDFRVAEDAGMSTVVTSVADLPEGLGLTSWRVPVTLAENQGYFWSTRARDAFGESPWSEPVSFIVDTVDESPTAPEPLRPVGAATTPTLQPELVVSNALDPEGQPLTYRFEVDVVPSFDSPGLQVSGAVPEGLGETAWVPGLPLADNTLHFWRSAASDASTSGPFAGSTFFVNVANDPPGAPVPLSPTGGIAVGTRTPELRVQNAVDLDGDALTYEFEVTDESGANVVASVTGVGETSPVTSWTVTPPLAEDTSFLWRARANDGASAGPWSAPQAFRVNAIADPPTAPALVSPAEGAVVDQPRPPLVVANATSPDDLVLTYTFELYAVAPNGTVTLRESATGVPEGVGTTPFTPAADLPDGAYRWRSRASDPTQDGPWMSVASFTVAVDRPPSAPTGVTAVPGDGTVALSWNANPEADVVAYRVYRASASGGPYTLRATVAAPGFADSGLANGVTVFYVVTALDAQLESARSGEVAATPRPPVIPAAIRFDPAEIDAECLLGGACWDEWVAPEGGECCPRWLYATIELPPGHSPSQIDRPGVRLGGSAAPDAGYWKIVDDDHDGIPELELRFGREKLPPLLVPGNNTVTVSGRVSGAEFRGSATIRVDAFDVELKITPSTLKKTSNGNDVEARLTFEDCVRASSVSVASLRLNGVVPVKSVVSTHGHKITVKFDRAAVAALLPVGNHVQVRVTGTLSGLAFQAVDYIRVIP